MLFFYVSSSKSKHMKKTLINLSLISFTLALFACGESDQGQETTKDVGQEVKDEIIGLEAEVTSIDSIKSEIDSASAELDNALEGL